MIKKFSHKGLEKLFIDGINKGIQPNRAQKLERILDRLDAAVTVQDMNIPGGRLHPYKGKEKGVWSLDVSGNWRITFRFEDGDAYDVDYLDPH